MTDFNVLKGLSVLREDLALYINTELFYITKKNNEISRSSDIRALVLAAYQAGLITMDECHHCTAALNLARWQVVSVNLAEINDIGKAFDTREALNAYFAERLIKKYDESYSSAHAYIEYCLSNDKPFIEEDKATAINLLNCASNAIQMAKAYVLIGLHTGLLSEATVAQYVAKANKLTEAMNTKTVA